ncbi:hypothetical protein P9D51_23590 [Bacillus sonorensis]|uniref:hypothetical protein n=1 Tax=Bacillus sonorensis TaxID=119858 RepID=UPI002DB7A1BC|nr:hypothetical protein [Bacillus sonorensis]MEC1429029.1 hypothetical protein [Bacillus sonorensis]
MGVSKAEKREAKDFAALILEAQGVDYEEWLFNQHKSVAEENSDFLKKALTQFVKKQHNDGPQ